MPSRRSRPLATQLSATPPARQRARSPVAARAVRARRTMTSSVTAWTDAARSKWWSSSGDSAGRRGTPKSRSKAGPVICRPGEELEVVDVQAERAVRLDVDQLLSDEVGVDRAAVGGEAHQLVLAGVDLEPAEVGERRVQEAERVREADLGDRLEGGAAAMPDRRGRPLADAVDAEDGRRLVRARQECRRGVGVVVLPVDDRRDRSSSRARPGHVRSDGPVAACGGSTRPSSARTTARPTARRRRTRRGYGGT